MTATVSLAEELNNWFAHAAVLDGRGRRREPSTAEVAAAITRDPTNGVNLSRSYLTGLRNGTQSNPTLSVIAALVTHFRAVVDEPGVEVSTARLVGDYADSQKESEWNRLVADKQIRSITMRAGSMTPDIRQQVLMMMDVLDPPPSF